jgi:predicted extracellular nuclease
MSPGRIEPGNPAFTDSGPDFGNSRKPLVGEFAFQGEALFVVANHFNAKSDEPLLGRRQPPGATSEAQRRDQAEVVRAFVDRLFDEDLAANIVVLGDLNDFAFSSPLAILTDGATSERDLHNLLETLPAAERYSYVFVGNAQTLDHILVSPGLLEDVMRVDVVHVNAEFADQASDHDPQVVHLDLAAGGTPTPLAATPMASACG